MAGLVNKERRAKALANRRKRHRAILDAAAGLFEKQPYDGVTLDSIGRRVGAAKGIASLHFSTKEELFLQVIKEQLSAWFDEMETRLLEAEGKLDRESFIELMTLELDRRKRMTRLLCVLRSVMEQNVEILPAQNFLYWLAERTLALAGTIEKCCGAFRPGDGAPFLRRLAVVVIGIRQPAMISSVFQALVEDDEMAPLRAEMAGELRYMIGRIMPSGSA